jgi:ssRNA-specific RNase YbeY (16S rRNA maturation enzyme)
MAAAVRNTPSRRDRLAGTGTLALHVYLVDERGRRLHVPGLAEWLRRVAPPRARGAVTIVLVSDPRMRALNRTYRGKDYATDVLSFGGDRSVGRKGRMGGKSRNGGKGKNSGKGRHGGKGRNARKRACLPIQPIPPNLGDIVIARGVAKRQARAAGQPELDELRLLALHGLLHLLGYDHERDNGRMRRVERRLRRTGGLREGLIERASE